MAFSSFGDAVALSQVIIRAIKSIRDVGRSESEFRQVHKQLQTLLDLLPRLNFLPKEIRKAAFERQQPVEQFLSRVACYKDILGTDTKGKRSFFKRTAAKVSWDVWRKDEVRALQGHLNIHLGTVNTFLAHYGIQTMGLGFKVVLEKVNKSTEELSAKIDEAFREGLERMEKADPLRSESVEDPHGPQTPDDSQSPQTPDDPHDPETLADSHGPEAPQYSHVVETPKDDTQSLDEFVDEVEAVVDIVTKAMGRVRRATDQGKAQCGQQPES
ncbi:hypothetical protein EJ06DRAFT_555238 [Trichodelitschia bisporula]|uniref:Fungal N-terminal domain-containing protein n=1 Tax=Trichodelitschia bisporula TaxID=703511 RepID=A0A6G1I368_9PEZI|nr:hypothetical protein EJ06DRAFT_555238 [Trichodelitschia bisporula]